jgi:hypothetical protein
MPEEHLPALRRSPPHEHIRRSNEDVARKDLWPQHGAQPSRQLYQKERREWFGWAKSRSTGLLTFDVVPSCEGASGGVSACVDKDRALQLELAGATKIYVAFHVGISYLKPLSGSVAINLLAAASVVQILAKTLKAARV